MSCSAKGICINAYRKAGSNAVHCLIQAENGGKWDFCKHQYMCRQNGRYELSKESGNCSLTSECKIEDDGVCDTPVCKAEEADAVSEEQPKKKSAKGKKQKSDEMLEQAEETAEVNLEGGVE